jgi:subtilisin family serine protease
MKTVAHGFAWLALMVSAGLWGTLPVCADGPSTAATGINSQGLGLDGTGIRIGQVEPNRPGRAADPPGDAAANTHPNVNPTEVFVRDMAPVTDANIDAHATQVAGVMISTHATHRSVAPGAMLYSSAYVTAGVNPGYQHALLAMQQVASRGALAINNSWGKPDNGSNFDGSTLLTLGTDWLSLQYNLLQVVAGNEGGGIPIPSDHFNGITVAYTRTVDGVFRQLDPGNTYDEDAAGARRSTDLVAPGTNITMPIPGGGHAAASGTSFAAPHVTGTAALLQQYGRNQNIAADPNFQGFWNRHEVIKVVLMNSADKVQDNGTFVHGGNPVTQGHLLDMEKTIDASTVGGVTNWTLSDAFTTELIPLDLHMGTGQLNAARALRQYRFGEWDPGPVPLIGWDYGVTTGAGDTNVYQFNQQLYKSV